VIGIDIEIITDEQRLRPEKSEVERLWASNTKAKELLGWQPQYGGLEGLRRGVSETVAWFSKPVHLASYKWNIYNL
jgi:nucleoside-diphosphate-sugar epimerase